MPGLYRCPLGIRRKQQCKPKSKYKDHLGIKTFLHNVKIILGSISIKKFVKSYNYICWDVLNSKFSFTWPQWRSLLELRLSKQAIDNTESKYI